MTVPPDLTAAPAVVPEAARRVEALSDSGRSRLGLAVDGARTAATRERRIAATVADLATGAGAAVTPHRPRHWTGVDVLQVLRRWLMS